MLQRGDGTLVDMPPQTAIGRPVAVSADELIEGATSRRPLHSTDSLSGASLERVEIGGERFVLKHLRHSDDFVARATGDVTWRPIHMWRSGLLDRLPECIDHAIVGCAYNEATNDAAILLRDVGEWLLPEGNDEIPLAHHLTFLEHMAVMHATFLGWRDNVGLLPPESRYTMLSAAMAETELARKTGAGVPPIVDAGWKAMPAAAPTAAGLVRSLSENPSPLVTALDTTPSTLVHGDWKAGNLGLEPSPSGPRTIVLDWAFPGRGAPCSDLGWYLSVNCDRLPQSKEDACAAYRAALEAAGVDTAGWWDKQLGLSLLGAFVQMGWSKVRGQPDELAWWVDQIDGWSRWL